MRIDRHLNQGDRGFSLVELIVAMFVIAVVLVAIIGVQTRALTTNAETNARQVATALANEAMEQLRALPYRVLERGLHNGFPAGDDEHVGGNFLVVNGQSYQLVTSPQILSDPWPPLFDGTGSHMQVRTDPAGRAGEFLVKAYVTEDQLGQANALGLAVIVQWIRPGDGEPVETVMFSTAHAPAGGCGDLNNAPFNASCQARFYGLATTGTVTMSVVGHDPVEGMAPLFPGGSFAWLQMSTGSTAARVEAQQVANVESFVRNGGTFRDDLNDLTDPQTQNWMNGFESSVLRASDDVVSPGAAPPHVGPDNTSSSTTTNSVSRGSPVSFSVLTRSDDPRNGTHIASTTTACPTGVGSSTVAAGNPCASGRLMRTGSLSGYLAFEIDGEETLRLARVLDQGAGSTDAAWAGRYAGPGVGNSTTGCTSVSGAGCVAAGMVKTVGTVNIGNPLTRGWDDGDAPQGLVTISNYREEASVQRGTSQTSVIPTVARSGQVRFWNESGAYQTCDLSFGYVDPDCANARLGEVTLTLSRVTVVVEGSVRVSPGQIPDYIPVDSTCRAEACAASAQHGRVAVGLELTVTPSVGAVDPFTLLFNIAIEGGQASVSYKEPADV